MYNTAGIILVISSVVLNTECVCGIRYLGYISVQGHMRQNESNTWFSAQYGETLSSCTVFSLGVQLSGKIYTCAIYLSTLLVFQLHLGASVF